MKPQSTQNEASDPEPISLKAGLYLIATPIGNLQDITLRALDTLSACDGIICEDTRVTGKLLKHYGIQKPLQVYNDHSQEKDRKKILTQIESGQSLALVSDAGMPLISDPGYKLVKHLLDEDMYVTTIPGANSVLAGLQLSGLPSDSFSYLGFLPPKTKARCDVLKRWRDVPGTLVCFESAARLLKTLIDIREVLGHRDVSVVREITKMYEETRHGSVDDIIEFYQGHGLPKGEIVLVIGAASGATYSEDDIKEMLQEALLKMSVKDAAEHVTERTGWSKKEIYARALDIKNDTHG